MKTQGLLLNTVFTQAFKENWQAGPDQNKSGPEEEQFQFILASFIWTIQNTK